MVRGKIKKEIRFQVWSKYGFRCAYCGGEMLFQDMQVDHIIPVSAFEGAKLRNKKIRHGVNNILNLNPSCGTCNQLKGNGSIEDLRGKIKQMLIDFKGFLSKFSDIQDIRIGVAFYFERARLRND